MRQAWPRRVVSSLVVLCSIACGAGCTDSNRGEVLDPSNDGLAGTWEYLAMNAYEARFKNCTGDAAVLEGSTLYEGLAEAPICLTAVKFEAHQSGDAFDVPPHTVTCSDGASGTVSGAGLIADPSLGGEWESQSDRGVKSVQTFTGVINGNTIELAETHRTFSGSFSGGCDFSPPLSAVITVD